MFWAVLEQILPPSFLVNLGFALFALDALLTSWVSNHLRAEQSVLCIAEDFEAIQQALLDALLLRPGGSSQIDELTVTKIPRLQDKVNAFRKYMKEQRSEALVRHGFILAAWDVVYFLGVSLLGAYSNPAHYLVMTGFFCYLLWLHISFKFKISDLRRGVMDRQHEATLALNELREICIWRQAPLNGTSIALSLKKLDRLIN
jgi:hypothetical protein